MIFLKDMEEYNLDNEGKIFIVFYDMIAEMFSCTKLNPIVTESLIRGRKVNISYFVITQSYFIVPTNTRLKSTNDSFNKLHLVIPQILILETLWIFTNSVLQNHIRF